MSAFDSAAGRVETRLSDDGFVATIVVDRAAKLNALTLSLLEGLRRAAEEVGASSARVVVLRTAGDRVFSVGADINHFADLDSLTMWRTWIATGHRAFAAIAALRQPTVAVVDGLAVGGGFELALAADFRVLAHHAQVALPETGLGTVPGWGGTERLTEIVGPSRAKELILTRQMLDAQRALEWGVATRTAAAQDLEQAVSLLVDELLGGAPIAVQLAKQIVRAASEGAPSAVLEALAGGLATSSKDFTEGIAAFRQKRTPHFSDN
jgi:enoyl-CoA hydratase